MIYLAQSVDTELIRIIWRKVTENMSKITRKLVCPVFDMITRSKGKYKLIELSIN